MSRAGPSSLIVLAAVTIGACGSVQRSELPAVPPSPPPTAIPALGPPPLLDLSGQKAISVYWVLGFLDEYLGRRMVEGHDAVAVLYCNEHDKARGLRTMLRRLIREQRLPDDLEEATFQECLISFRSPELSRGLDSLYTVRRPTGMFVSGPVSRELIALHVSRDMFDLVGREARLAYLSGAYYRYGRDGSLGFANAAHKADLSADLLRELGARAVERETFSGLPNGNTVRFAPTPALTAWFEQRFIP